MLNFIGGSIARVYSAVIVVGVTLGLTIFTIIIGYYNQSRTMSDLETKAANSVKLAAVSLAEPIWNFDTAAMQGVVTALLLDSDVLGLRVMREGGSKPDIEIIREGQAGKSFEDLLRDKNNLASEAKVLRENSEIATVEIVTSTRKVEALVRYTSTMIAVFALVLVLFLSGFIWLLGKRIIKMPIEALRLSADQLASGNLAHEIDTSRRDEIGSLAKSFDRMRDAIRRTLGIIEDQNRTLEEKILLRTLELRRKTNDIQNMLQNMPQGILTVSHGEVIHPEYSAYLETILETNDIAGKKLMDVVFSRTNLGSDLLSQIEAVVSACVGEDRMNFEMNSALMISEFDLLMQSGKYKSLELSWSPICNDEDVCEKLMICVRDVTELKVLAAEAGKQKRELEIIGEILSVSQEKFHEFILSSADFVESNRQAIEKNTKGDLDVVALLFRNMHTIKGNARTYGLYHLTNVIHEVEQAYENLRKNPEEGWDQKRLLDHLESAASSLREYASINEEKLGRKGVGRRGGVDKYLMVQKDHIEALVHSLEQSELLQVGFSAEKYNHLLSALKLIGTQKVSEILSGVIGGLPSLAKELGKEVPNVIIREEGVAIRTQTADLVKNSFIHLMRNSLDHGIETGEVRAANGKAPRGTIVIEASVNEDHLRLMIRDDGKGLGVGIIRRKALEAGLITENENLPPEVLAQLIFTSGFSTAKTVTEVSGRGVGMDAVKSFVEREGGTIDLRFIQDDPANEFRAFETVISLPASHAVQI